MEALSVYTDLHSLAKLRGQLEGGENARLTAVAGKFAAVFTQMMVKSMRDAGLGEGIFDSSQSLFYRELFDQQLALNLSEANGVGIRSMLVEHLRQATGITQEADSSDAEVMQGIAAYRVVSDLSAEAVLPATTQDSRPWADTQDTRNDARNGYPAGL